MDGRVPGDVVAEKQVSALARAPRTTRVAFHGTHTERPAPERPACARTIAVCVARVRMPSGLVHDNANVSGPPAQIITQVARCRKELAGANVCGTQICSLHTELCTRGAHTYRALQLLPTTYHLPPTTYYTHRLSFYFRVLLSPSPARALTSCSGPRPRNGAANGLEQAIEHLLLRPFV